MKNGKRIILTGFLFNLLFSLSFSITTIEELDEMAEFSFAIISDHKGFSPLDGQRYMTTADKWIKEGQNRFIIGLGDHLKKDWENTFLQFIGPGGDSLWYNHFYPNIADGENEYYGAAQNDWGAGAPLLEACELSRRSNVIIRDNQVEYKAVVTIKGFTVHIIQLHFSDKPDNPDGAFKEDTRQYMIDMLDGIDKTEKDIIVIGAHSRTGEWVNILNTERRDKVLSKADLVLSATTHNYKRFAYDRDNGAICLNTGALGYAINSDNGYVEVHVLDNPVRLITQYHSTESGTERNLEDGRFAYLKDGDGKIMEADWSAIQGSTDIYPTGFQVDSKDGNMIKVFSNPINSKTSIHFAPVTDRDAVLSIYSNSGRLVFQQNLEIGQQSLDWDPGINHSGFFLLKLLSGGRTAMQRVVIVR